VKHFNREQRVERVTKMQIPNKVISQGADGRVRVQTRFIPGSSKTQQQFKDQCDVNKIMAKYQTTGQFLHLSGKQGVFADVSQITDYNQMHQKILDAKNMFGALPSNIRLRFGNDPAQLLAFMQDPQNLEEGIKLGIYEKPKMLQNNNDDLNDDKKTKASGSFKKDSKKSSTPQDEE